jgi:hypothetical protein
MTLADDGLSVESGPARSGSSGDGTNSFPNGRFFYSDLHARRQRAINDAIYVQPLEDDPGGWREPIASAEEKKQTQLEALRVRLVQAQRIQREHELLYDRQAHVRERLERARHQSLGDPRSGSRLERARVVAYHDLTGEWRRPVCLVARQQQSSGRSRTRSPLARARTYDSASAVAESRAERESSTPVEADANEESPIPNQNLRLAPRRDRRKVVLVPWRARTYH